MSWKDLFYFQEKDKRAIIALLSLILISGSAYIFVNNTNKTSTDEQSLALTEFDEFQKQLTPLYGVPKQDVKTGNKDNKPANPSKTKLSEGQTLDLNSVNIKALKKIPGIGDTFAKRIIEYRDQLGGFTHAEQLLEVKGISSKKFEAIKSFVIIKKTNKKIRINSTTISHPYISQKQTESIIQYRNSNGKVKSIDDLASLEGFTPRDIDRLEKYVSFN